MSEKTRIMDDRPFNVLLIGLGRAGRIHMKNVLSHPLCNHLYIYDVETFPQTADNTDCTYVNTIGEALSRDDVKCVIVCSPTHTHYEYAMLSLSANKHVLSEKPLCSNREDIESLFLLASERNLLLFTALNRRYDPHMCRARDLFMGGTMGAPLHAIVTCRDFPYPPSSYLQVSGGIVADCSIHDIDCLSWMMDSDASCSHSEAWTTNAARGAGVDEHVVISLLFSNGTRASIFNSRCSPVYDQRYEIVCEKGSIVVHNPSGMSGSFAERYGVSYKVEMDVFMRQVGRGDTLPNVSKDTTCYLHDLVGKCADVAKRDTVYREFSVGTAVSAHYDSHARR